MSGTEDAAGTDRSGSRKGRFTVKFSIGRLDSVGSDTGSPATAPESPHLDGMF